MSRIERNFSLRAEDEQQDFLRQTWCNTCQEADLGMTAPVEYELDGRIFIEGQCVRCGDTATTEIVEED